jgi:hypothetical protein
MDYKENLYDRFTKQASIVAQKNGQSLDEFLENLEFRSRYTRGFHPDLFPCECICGEILTAEAFQFDDSSNLKSYILGAVCTKNLTREFARLEVVKKLGKYLTRPESRRYQEMPEELRQQARDVELWDAKVVSNKIRRNINRLNDLLKSDYEYDTAFSEGICVAYGIIPKNAILIYFDRNGDIW